MHFFFPLSVPPHTPYSTRSLLLRLLRLSLPDGRHGSEGEPEISTTSPFVSGTRPPLPAWHTITVSLLPLVPGTYDNTSLAPEASAPVFSVSCKMAASRHWKYGLGATFFVPYTRGLSAVWHFPNFTAGNCVWYIHTRARLPALTSTHRRKGQHATWALSLVLHA